MEILLPLIIGLVVGAGGMFWWLRKQLEAQEEEHAFELTRIRDQLERGHEERLKEAIQGVRDDYAVKLRQQEAKLKHVHDAELQARLLALQAEHQEELARAIAPSPPEPPRVVTEKGITLADLGDFEALFEPIEDEEEAEASLAEPEKTIPVVLQPSLAQKIAATPNPVQLKPYLRHPSDRVRADVAIALGKIVQGKPMRPEIGQAVSTLAVLARDSAAIVRQAAVEAIGMVKSDSVIPLLQQALRDPDRQVVKAASAAIARFKFYSGNRKR